MRLRKKLAKIYNTVIFYLLVNNNHDPIWLQKYICNKILIQTFRLRDKKTPLHFAVIQNNKAAVEYLINNDVNIDSIDKNGNTALHMCAERGFHKCVQYLIKEHVYVHARNQDGDTALDLAQEQCWRKEIEQIMDHIAGENAKKYQKMN